MSQSASQSPFRVKTDSLEQRYLQWPQPIESNIIERRDNQNDSFLQSGLQSTRGIVSSQKSPSGLQNSTDKKHLALGILSTVIKFIVKLRRKAKSRRKYNLKPRIINIINDKASDFEYFMKQASRNHEMKEDIKTTNENVNKWILMPESPLKLSLDITTLCLTILNLIYIPFDLAFKTQDSYYTLDGLKFFCILVPFVFYIIEIPVTLKTAIYLEGHLRLDKEELKRHYMAHNLYKDILVVCIMPGCIYLQKLLLVIWILRFNRVSQYLAKLEAATVINQVHTVGWELGKLIGSLIFVNHILACSWRLLAHIEEEFGVHDNWVTLQKIENASWETQYIYSFYWTTITSTTIGYGDIVPINKYEMLFVIVMVPTMLVFFGYALGSIQSLFAQMKGREDEFIHKMGVVNKYIRKHNLNPKLQMKIRNYLDCYLRSNDNEDEANELVDLLHDDIKYEVNEEVYLPIIRKSEFVSQNFSREVQSLICQQVKYKKLLPGQTIMETGDMVENLVFVMTGKVQLYIPRGDGDTISPDQHLRYLGPGDQVAELYFFKQSRARYHVRAVDYSEVIVLRHEDLIKTLKKSPDDYERYLYVIDNLIFNPNYKKLTKTCEICLNHHLFDSCPFAFFQGKKHHRKSRNHKRLHFPRGRQKSSSRSQWQKIVDDAIYASLDNSLLEEVHLTAEFFDRVGLIMEKPKVQKHPENEPKEILFKQGVTIEVDEELEDDNPFKEETQIQTQKPAFNQKSFKHSFTKLKTNLLLLETYDTPQYNQSSNPKEKEHNQKNQMLNLRSPKKESIFGNEVRKTSKQLTIKPEIIETLLLPKQNQNQLDLIKLDYIENLKKDELVGFESQFDFKYFYPSKNFVSFINKNKKIGVGRDRISLIRRGGLSTSRTRL